MEISRCSSATALLVAALLCVDCGAGKSALAPDGSAGSGGDTVGAAGQAGDTDAQSFASDAAMETSDSSAISDGVDDPPGDASGADVPAPPRFAKNGVLIPPPALAKDSCAVLQVQSVPCSGDAVCKPLSCDCGGGSALSFDRCFVGSCVAGISCPAACALGSVALDSVLPCLIGNPVCKSDSDCQGSAYSFECLVPPNATSGECVTGGEGSPCLADKDCRSKVCVVDAAGLGVCGRGLNGPCNADAQCPPGYRCALAPGEFAGFCTDGGNGSLCLTSDDCQPSMDCAIIANGPHVCTSRGRGAPCGVDADCASGLFCIVQHGVPGGSCDTGAVGATCVSASQCHVPFCVNLMCSQGLSGDRCTTDSDCQVFCANGVCSDGKLGSRCKLGGGGCIAGLVCNPSGPLVCIEPGALDAGGQ